MPLCSMIAGFARERTSRHSLRYPTHDGEKHQRASCLFSQPVCCIECIRLGQQKVVCRMEIALAGQPWFPAVIFKPRFC